jgi:hypothetical protein
MEALGAGMLFLTVAEAEENGEVSDFSESRALFSE